MNKTKNKINSAIGPIIFDLKSTSLDPEERNLLTHPNVGGIILFSRNFESFAQLKKLIQDIKDTRPNCLIVTDHEGGSVQRFRQDFTKLPSMHTLGEQWLQLSKQDNYTKQDMLAQQIINLGQTMAKELKNVGVDLSLAPVVDVKSEVSKYNPVIKERSISHCPHTVYNVANLFIQGMSEFNMPATLKHFPGHGGVIEDSHHNLPVDNRSLNELSNDLHPFKNLINNYPKVAVMPSHVLYKSVDAKYPAIFSKTWLQEILREDLNFKGAIISDDLSMRAANSYGDLLKRTRLSLSTGTDFVLICNDFANAKQVILELEYQDNPNRCQLLLN